jgi:glc operon protein GlcG
MTRIGFAAALLVATNAWAQTPPAKLADVTMSTDATRRAHLQEINLETARKLADACVAFSRAANPNGGATVVVVGPSGNIVYAARSDGQIPNNFDSAFEKAKMALYMRAPTRSMVNRWGSPEAALARAPLNLYLVEGGYPIIVEDMMIGALGVGDCPAATKSADMRRSPRCSGRSRRSCRPSVRSRVGPAETPVCGSYLKSENE